MGNREMKSNKEKKKKKATAITPSVPKLIVSQPELVTKKKKSLSE